MHRVMNNNVWHALGQEMGFGGQWRESRELGIPDSQHGARRRRGSWFGPTACLIMVNRLIKEKS